jgi:hypothetical protein
VDNPLSKLSLDYWYHVVIVASAAVFLLAASDVLKALPLAPVLAMSGGAFLVGLGEWINHPLQTSIMTPSAFMPGGIITGHPRNNRPIGLLFDAVGLALIGYGIYRIW